MPLRFLVVSIVACLFVSGCAVNSRKSLPIAARKEIKSNAIVVATDQKQLLLESKPISCTGNILADLVDDTIEDVKYARAKNKIQQLGKTLKEFNIEGAFRNDLFYALKHLKWLNTQNTTINKNTKLVDHGRFFTMIKENSVLLAHLEYNIHSKLTAITMHVSVILYKKNEKNVFETTPVYKNNYTYIYALPKKINSCSEAIALWNKNNGQLIKTAMKLGAENIARQVVPDINDPTKDLHASMPNTKNIYFKDYYLSSYPLTNGGKLIRRYNNFYFIRLNNNEVYIVNKNALAKKPLLG